MKLLHHLIVSATCIAALVTTTPTSVAAQEINVSDSESGSAEDTTKRLRGSEPNYYDDADLYPFPDESEDVIALIPAGAVEIEIDLDEVGEEFKTELVSVGEEDVDDPEVVPITLIKIVDENSELVQDEDVEVTVPDHEDHPSRYHRHLRSLVDPAPAGQIQLAETTPPTEKVTPPSNHNKPNLRGMKQGKL